jgi:hypothetical protein
MEDFLAGGARFAPAVDYSLPPDNLDKSILQPIGPIVMYCFIISVDRNNNKTYKCKQCGHEFKGQPCVVVPSKLYIQLFTGGNRIHALFLHLKSSECRQPKEIQSGKDARTDGRSKTLLFDLLTIHSCLLLRLKLHL